MKKVYLLFLLAFAFALPFCTTSKKAVGDKNMKLPTVSYVSDISPLMKAHCSPCHFPEDGGKKPPFDSYETVRNNVDSILFRVQLPQANPKFMPFKLKKPALSDSLINVIKVWKAEGMALSIPPTE